VNQQVGYETSIAYLLEGQKFGREHYYLLLWHQIVLQKFTDMLEDCIVPIFRAEE
jgi:hypothetical protein